MPAQYKIILYSSAGVKQAEFVNFDYLTYTKRLNAPGSLKFRVEANHNAVQYMTDKAQVEVYRRNLDVGLDWYADFVGLVRDDVQEQDADGRDTVTLICPGVLHMLEWRGIAWKAGTANKSLFTTVKGETLLKTLVQYSITSSATTGNGRVADGTMSSPVSISIQADAAGGNVLGSWGCAWRPLLEELQAIAKVAGGDFDLIKIGATTFEFRWYSGQRGADYRTGASALKFSTKLGNMAKPKLTRARTRVRTQAVVAGAGDSGGRETATRTGNSYSSSNVVEQIFDARNLPAGANLNAEGDTRLGELKLREEMTFNILQQPSCYYGKHYAINGALGDLVNVEYRSYSASHKIIGYVIGWDDKGESVSVETQV